MLSKLKSNNDGDTIVEVMIVLAILGLAVGISYATANRSLLNARQAQENSAATELVQTQVENLSILAPVTNPPVAKNVFAPAQPYCIKDAGAVNPFITDISQCTFGTNNLYTIQIWNCDKVSHATTPCSTVSDANTLVTQATWPDVLGQGTDTVTLVYKAHPQ